VPKRTFIYSLFILTFISIVSFSYLSERSLSATACSKWGFNESEDTKYYINPQKVVVEPWYGEHHVYAIFIIPRGYLNDHLFKVSIKDSGTYCGILDFAGTTVTEGVEVKPGNYLMKALFPTRVAFWLILQGKGVHLKQSSNWVLGYSKIK